MPLAEVVRTRPRSSAPSTASASVATTLFTGDHSTWVTLGAPTPYAPAPLAATVAHTAHIQLFYLVRTADDLPTPDASGGGGGGGSPICAIAAVGLAPHEQARLREAALAHRSAGVLIFASRRADHAQLLRDAAARRWPPPATAPNADVCCPPAYDTAVKIDAVRQAYPELQAPARADSSTPSNPTPHRRRIAADQLRADEAAWRRQLANAAKPKESSSNFFLNMLAE